MAELVLQWQSGGVACEGRITGDTPATLGREAGCTVQIESSNQAVSRKHAQIRRRADGFAISDLTNGRNPVAVNGRVIGDETVLAEGDSVTLGDVTLRITAVRGISAPSGGPMMKIRWEHEGRAHEERVLGGDPVIIGRDAPAAILIPSPHVSRQHARIEEKGGRFVITDVTAGRNPITVNQRVLSGERYLSPGDVIILGGVTVVVTLVQGAAPQSFGINQLRSGRLVVCTNCHREVDGSLQDCPWCGTALVNAETVLPR